MRKLCCTCIFLLAFLTGVYADDLIKWVDFDVPVSSLETAMKLDIESQGKESCLKWTEILALASTRKGSGKVTGEEVKKAAEELSSGRTVEEILGNQKKYYDYYLGAYEAVLGGLLGNYAYCDENGQWHATYGLKAFCPVAEGWGFSHCQDFGNARSFGFKRKHLGNDLMGALGSPIAAVEGGTVEALGWNRYGGWRVGIRSFDGKRYYYYAHLKKDAPYAPGLELGDTVNAGDIIGFMGRTGYSDKENTNNIEVVHLHFGIELIFDEEARKNGKEIWIDAYPIVELLKRHRVTVAMDETTNVYKRKFDYIDLDRELLPD